MRPLETSPQLFPGPRVQSCMSKSLRLSLLALAAISILPAVAVAQTPPEPPTLSDHPAVSGAKKIARHVAFLTEKLGLNASQQASLRTILVAKAAQKKAIWADTSLSEEQKKAKWHPLHKAFHEQIEALLTPEQKKIFATLHHHHDKDGDGDKA